MALKSVVENIDEVDEAFRAEYSEKEVEVEAGKPKVKLWVLDVEGLQSHPEARALKAALERVRREKADVQGRLTEAETRLEAIPDDFDPEELATLRAQKEEWEKNHGRPDEAAIQSMRTAHEQRVAAMERKHAEDLAKRDEEISKRDAALERRVRDDDLTKALNEVGVEKDFFRAAQAMHRPAVKMRRDEETGDYETFVETDLGEVPVAEYIEAWSKSDEGRRFVPQARGGGAGGGQPPKRGGEVNPWAKDTLNLTQQGRIIATDRERARRMMREAKVSEAEISRTLGAPQQSAA